MKFNLATLRAFWVGDRHADRVVPPSGYTAQLTLFAAAAMAFLAVFALALSLASGRLAASWGEELRARATIRIVAPLDQRAAQTEAALRILETTAGVQSARSLSDDEQHALLAPWFGPDLALTSLPVPRLIEVIETAMAWTPQAYACVLLPKCPALCWMIINVGARHWCVRHLGYGCWDGFLSC